PAQVGLQPFRGAHEPGQGAGAERGVGVAVLGGVFEVGDQAGVRLQGGLVGDAGGQAPDRAEQGLRHGGADLVERGDRVPYSLRPAGEVGGLGGGAVLLGGVVAVVAGELQVGEVEQRV